MRIEMLDGGFITASAAVFHSGDDPDARLRFPVPAWVIETDTERILIDTGLHPDAPRDPGARYGQAGRLFELELAHAVADQVDAATLTRVVLTHLHWDHAGGLELLPASVPIVLQRREWDAARDDAAIARNFLFPGDYAVLEERELVLLDGDHDLLGDGAIELLLTPGHTPGHQSIRVGGTLVLGADVAHFASVLDDHRFPSFADDFGAQAASAERLRAMRDDGARVIPGHDPDVLRPGPVAVP
jgi:glyoxylase-like metal-dependent hydrolase (beta-lactamase superfamily II)